MPALAFSPPPPSNPYPRLHPDYPHAHFDPSHNPYHDAPHHHPFPTWQPPIAPFPPPPPPQLVHRVWILDCRSCGTFLTNRGMKAVLLLRPNVSLFSTDALPVNCSAYSTNPDALRPPPCRPFSASSAPRTCECLTQTLCCHTCGAAVGYMIVIPCSKCTTSISATNRATNGHRFVFHSSEIISSERHHIPNEPGVLPIEYPNPPPPPPPSSPPPLAPAYPPAHHSAGVTPHRRPSSFVPSQPFYSLQTSSPSPGSDYLLSPQLDSPDVSPSSLQSSPDLPPISPSSPRRSPHPRLQSPFPHNHMSQTLPMTTPEPYPRKLRAGDVLYWHHLSRHGEIPGVEEDPRARVPNRVDLFKFLER